MSSETDQTMDSSASADQPDQSRPSAQDHAAVDQIIASLAELASSLERIRVLAADAAGLGVSAFTLLTAVAEAGDAGTLISTVADKLGIRPQGLSATVRDLAEAGLLERTVDPADGRARRLRITEAGHERLAIDDNLEALLATEVLAQVPHPSIAKLVLSRLGLALRRVLDQRT